MGARMDEHDATMAVKHGCGFETSSPIHSRGTVTREARTCSCKDVPFGSYQAQVELYAPDHLKREDGRGICIDVCLALEVSELWRCGVHTTGCCCGHGRLEPTICVAPGSVETMLALGYLPSKLASEAPAFTAKTGWSALFPVEAADVGGWRPIETDVASKLIERLESWPIAFVSGVCMCGAEMDNHPYDNHSPTDSGEYNVSEAIKEAKAALLLPPYRCVVPTEPTQTMVQAACDAVFGPQPSTPEDAFRKMWKAALAASPPLAEGQDQGSFSPQEEKIPTVDASATPLTGDE